MAILHWDWGNYTLMSRCTIEDVCRNLASNELGGLPAPPLNCTDVKYGATNVHGTKGKFIIGVLFLPISGSNYWRIVACGGEGSVADATSDINTVINIINTQATLYC
jgi:hypothetical protein